MIQFGQPWALLALVSIPVIVLLYVLRPARRRVVLSSVSLWREALTARQRGFGLQRLLRDLSLLLLLVLAVLLSLTLADPRWVTQAGHGDDLVLVLDVSASMRTRIGAATRFEAARREARTLINGMAEGRRMLILTSGRSAVLRSTFESDKQRLHDVLAAIEPGDEAGRPREALELALSLLRNRDGGRVYFLSDGAYDASLDFGPAPLEHLRFATPARNVAITRFDLRPEPGAPDRFQALLTVRNYTAESLSVPARVSLEGQVLFERELELAPRGRETVVVSLSGRLQGRARARIEAADDLAADDEAFAVLGARATVRVLLLTPGNFYLESVLRALPGVVVETAEALDPERLPALARAHDLVVFDRVQAPRLTRGNYLLVDALPPGLPFTNAGVLVRPQIAGRSDSALLRHVDLTGVSIDAARQVAIAAEARGVHRLFWSHESDLALVYLDGDVRVVYLGFDLLRSSFPLQAAFPLFLHEALAWLSPHATGIARTQWPAGEPYPVPAREEAARLIVRTPDGEGLIFDPSGQPLWFDQTSRAGIYGYTFEYPFGNVDAYFAVNLTDERESDVNALRAAPAPPAERALGAELRDARIALWPLATWVALGLLLLEWAVWLGRRGHG